MGSSPIGVTKQITLIYYIKTLVLSYKGYYCGLLIHLSWFESTWDRKIMGVWLNGYNAGLSRLVVWVRIPLCPPEIQESEFRLSLESALND